MPSQDPILLQTKLHPPRRPKDLIIRTRLVELLNQEIDRQLILVCAPAGFGKTTLVSTWLDRKVADQTTVPDFLPSAWLSLDENDSDLNLFLRYFIAAIRTIFSNACENTFPLLQAQQQPPEAVILSTFINELERLPGEAILVLDDYHTLHGTEVHKLLEELVRHWPRPLHMVLISRTSPPIPLSSLRARGKLGEIRTRDLRFTPEETAAYLSKTQFALMGQNALPMLEERFEGWPAGLHLAAISLRSAGSREAVLSALASENLNITSYLVDEVLSQQFPAIHSFLLYTSILDRFCARLCEAVIGEADPAWNAGACLEWIERSELFLIPLDNRREWYRYHHLFQELLQDRLSLELTAEEVNGLHRRASAWFEGQGLIDEALRHALAAGDLELARRQMSLGLCDVLNREDRPTLERWLRMLPEEMIQQHPELLMIKVWALQFVWRLDLQAQTIQRIESLLDSEAGANVSANDLQILRGQILLIKAQFTYFSDQTASAADMCREALAILPLSWSFARGSAMLYLGFSMQANGEMQAAEKLLLDEYEHCTDKTDIYPLILLQTLGYIYLWTGQLDKCTHIGRLMIQGATRRGNLFTKSWGDYYLGVACYLFNDLETANQHFSQILLNRYVAHFAAYRDAVAGLSLIHQIKGESAETRQLLEAISQSDLEDTGTEDSRTSSLRARLQIMQGDLEGARMWAGTINGSPPDLPIIFLEEPQITRVRVLLVSNTDADRRLALQFLDTLDQVVERTHNTRYKIEILALRALALEAQGETDGARTALKQSLELARPGGFIRIFVDMGAPMQVLLERLVEQDYSAELVGRILSAFPEDEKYRSGSSDLMPAKRQPSLAVPALSEPLTPRELEILSLLRGPLSIKEIALKLNISYATAKRHTINVYGKLGANGRWEAVTKAEELDILPPR